VQAAARHLASDELIAEANQPKARLFAPFGGAFYGQLLPACRHMVWRWRPGPAPGAWSPHLRPAPWRTQARHTCVPHPSARLLATPASCTLTHACSPHLRPPAWRTPARHTCVLHPGARLLATPVTLTYATPAPPNVAHTHASHTCVTTSGSERVAAKRTHAASVSASRVPRGAPLTHTPTRGTLKTCKCMQRVV